MDWTKTLDATFRRLPATAVFALMSLAVVALSMVDLHTGADLRPVLILPLLFGSWYSGRRMGVTLALVIFLVATGLALYDNFTGMGVHTYGDIAIGGGTRFATYLLLAWIVGSFSHSRQQEKELTSFIVHDLRSPISSSITGLQTLEAFAENLGEIEREMVDLALVSNQRALTLVNAILDTSKIQDGSMAVKREEVDVDEFVDEQIRQVELWARSSEVKIQKGVAVKLAVLDPELTGRVIVNLLSNALKYAPPGSAVTVTAEPNAKGDEIRFGVHDNGPGIPESYADKIFEPFQQVKGTRGGTGLGLTFCRLAVKAQRGRIWVESKLGKGTSMLFTIGGQNRLEPILQPRRDNAFVS